jgi:hypothetical protein
MPLYPTPEDEQNPFPAFDAAFAQRQVPPQQDAGLIDIATPTAPLNLGIPQVKPPHQGFFQRITDKPGGRNALLAFGAAMLSSPDFFSGFGKAGLAYGQALQAEEDKLRPQISKDGNFQYKWNNQTGEYDFEETAAGLRARQLAREKLETQSDDKRYVADRGYDSKVYGVDKTTGLGYAKLDHQDVWEKDRNSARIEAARLGGDFSLQRARLTAAASQGKPPPVGALKTFDEHAGKASAADGILTQGNRILNLMDSGQLSLNMFNNLRSKAAQATGVGANESTRAYGELQQFTQQLVNGILLDARGVQTDGDAQRAKIMSLVSSGDDEGARREIQNTMRMLERGRDYARARAEDISRQYGIEDDATNAVRGSDPPPRPSARPKPAARGSLRSKYGLE